MMTEYSEKQLDIFKRLGNQLSITQQILESHPAVNEKLKIVQMVLLNFNRHAQWSSAGRLARLLMGAKMALEGYERDKSASGFVGPAWIKLQQGAFGLMKATLNITERRKEDLLLTFNEIISLGTVFVSALLLSHKDEIFPKTDAAASKRAGFLLREMGLTFLVHSKLIQAAYSEVTSGLGINEKSQKLIIDIGVSFLLMILILVDAEDNSKNEDMIEAMTPYLKEAIDSVVQTIEMAIDRGIVTQERGSVASSQVQFMKIALDNGDPEAIHEAIRQGLEAFEIPYSEVKIDITMINKVCAQLNESFNNIFFQSKLTETTMTQNA